MGGHSFGGMTALAVAERDERIKAVFGLDAWLWCIHERIQCGEFKLNVPQIHIITENFPPLIYEFFKYDTV